MTDSTNLSAEMAGDATSTDELNSAADMAASEALDAAAPAGSPQRVQLAQAVVDVPLPQPGETVVVQAAAGQTLHFLFDPATATSSQENGDLVLQINGGEVVIEGWQAASSGETPVEITNTDGTVINMADFLVAIGLPPEAVTEPAAGGGEPGGALPGTTPNEGAGFTPGQAPTILGGLGPEGPVDPTALSYRVPEREPFIFDIEEDDEETPPDGTPDARDDGDGTPGTDPEEFCVDEENLVVDGGEGGYGNGYDIDIQTPTNGSAIKTSVTVDAGATLTFSFNFLDGESPGQLEYFDFAVVVIGDQVFKLADILDADIPNVGGSFDETTGYLTFSFTFTSGGTYDIGFAVLNEGDQSVDPALLIDDVSITGGAFADGFETDLGNWDVLGNASIEGDFDGLSPVEGTQQVVLEPAAPSAEDIENFFNLPAGTLLQLVNPGLDLNLSVSGNVLDNDDLGPDTPTSITAVSYVGGESTTPLTVTIDDSGLPVVVFTANDGDHDVWTMEFNVETGDYTFTLVGSYSHGGAGEDEAHEQFSYTITDADGDSDTATVTICIKDDVPQIEFFGAEGGVSLDETVNGDDDDNDGTPLATATFNVFAFVDADYGADGQGAPEAYALTLSTPGADSGLIDTATGDPVLLTLEGGDVVGRNGDGQEVFRISFDAANEEITVTQLRAVAHGDPTDPDEADTPESILGGLVGLQVTVTDGDGDTDTETVDIGSHIQFEDDGPSLTIEGGEGRIALDETDGDADDGALGGLLASVTFAIDELLAVDAAFGSDGEKAGGGLSFALSLNGAASGLVDAQTNQNVVLTLEGGQIVGKTEIGGLEVFRISVDSETGAVTVTQSRAVEHDNANDPDEAGSPESILPDTVILNVTATDGDDDTAEAEFDLGSRIDFEDDGPTAGLTLKQGAEIRLDESVGDDPADPNANDEEASAENDIGYATILGSALFTDNSKGGSDGAASKLYSLQIPDSAGDVISGLIDAQTNQQIFLFNGSGTIYGVYGTNAADALANAATNTVFTVSVNATGDVTVHQYRAVEHDNDNDPDESASPEIMDPGKLLLVQTVTDGDDDSDTASVDLGSIIKFEDDGPSGIVVGGEGELRLDESLGDDEVISPDAGDIGFDSISAAAFFAGVIDFGSDGPGATATFALTLPSNGVPSGLFETASGHQIFLFDNGGVIEGREGIDAADAATGTVVFTVSIVGGNIEVHQYEAIKHNDSPTDHDEADDPESIAPDVLTLEVTATDGDDDPVSGTVDLGQLIKFEDDGPSATLANKTQPIFLTLDESVGADAGDANANDEANLAAAPLAIGFATASAATLFNETAAFGEDGAAAGGGKAYELVLTGGNGVLSGMVDAVSNLPVVLVDNNGVIEGRAGGQLVFTIEINGNTGQVTVNQFRAIEHGNTNDHDEAGNPETIDAGIVGVKLTVTDGDGDEAESATAELGQLIKFEDDGPKAELEPKLGAEIRLDETDGDADDGAPGGLLANVTVLGSALFTETIDPGEDGQASKTYGLDLSAPNVDSGLNDTATGQNVLLQQLDANTIVGTINGGATEVFRITVDPATGAVTVTQSRAIEHPVAGDPDEAAAPQSILGGLVDLTVDVTDGDGDSASDSIDLGQVIKFEDDGPTFNPANATPGTVSESDPLPDQDTGSIGVNFGSDGFGDVTSITGPAGLTSDGHPITYSFDAATNTLTGSANGNTIFTVSINASGQYTFTLSGPIDHGALEDSKALQFNFTATDGDDDPVNGSFSVNVIDDEPEASHDTGDTTGSFDSINITIIFDRSGSMDEDPNVDGFSTRLDLARAAIASLLAAYDSFADVNIKIIDFAGNANHSEWFTGPDALVEANAYLAGLTAEGETDYQAAITETQNFYDVAGDEAPDADKSVVYFLSDGNPTEGGDLVTHQLTDAQTTQWESFLATHGIEAAFAVGIGGGVNEDALDEIAVPDGPQNPVVLDTGNEAAIFDTLLLTVTGQASGNVLTDGTADDFGADGEGAPKIVSIEVDGDVYEYDGTNIIKVGQGIFAPATSLLVLTTALGGAFAFDFSTGAYTYEAADGVTDIEDFTYTIKDGDGDLSSAHLQINVVGTEVLEPNLVFGTDANDSGANALIGDNNDALADIISGGDGNDRLTANGSNDLLIGGAGTDELFGGGGRDVLIGGSQGEFDTGLVRAADGADYLNGGDGADFLFGNEGNDILVVGTGDEASGGLGRDKFILTDNAGFGSINGDSTGEFSIAGSEKGNTLVFNGSFDVDASKIDSIETISMRDTDDSVTLTTGTIDHFAVDGADTLTLSAADVIGLGQGVFDPAAAVFGERAAIKVDGDANDVVNLEGGNWTNLGADASTPGYNVWVHDPSGAGTSEDAYVLISTTIGTVTNT